MNKRAILQLTLEGEYVQTFESTKAAARSLGCEGTSISKACMKNKPFRGYYFKYKTPLPPRRNKKEVLEEWNLALIEDLENRIDELPRYYITSKIHQIMLNNDTISQLKQSMDEPTIRQKGRPSIAVKQFNSEGQYIKTFGSIKEASEETNETPDKIRAVINGKTPLTPRGWHYQKVEETKTKQKETKEEDNNYLDFYIPRGREDRKKMLYNYVSTRLENYYFQLTKKEAIMHKQFLVRLIKSL